VTAEVRDDRPGHQHHQADGSQRHQNRRDVERGGQDQAHRSQDLQGADGLDGADTEVFDPSLPKAASFSLGRASFMAPLARTATASSPAMIHKARFIRVLLVGL